MPGLYIFNFYSLCASRIVYDVYSNAGCSEMNLFLLNVDILATGYLRQACSDYFASMWLMKIKQPLQFIEIITSAIASPRFLKYQTGSENRRRTVYIENWENKVSRAVLMVAFFIIYFSLKMEEAQERDRSNRKYEAKRSKDRREAMLDGVAPRETGREAALAKKRALNAYHKREKSPDIELSEADLMGERKYQEKRENRLAERREQKLAPILSKMDAYKAKEDATMAMFKKMAEEQKKRGGL
ncbi:hypothetical protein K501DRAFT_265969 [Backusella circina FSU 941]|nr:hypothetical protein K501DRAFT_265969 [Backusella circina FSU 941]